MAIPAWWVCLEFLRSIGPWGFSWGVLGISQGSNLIIFQLAKIAGVYGLSYVLLLANVILAEFFLISRENRQKTLKILGIGILILILVLGLGFYSFRIKIPAGKTFKVALIQGNIPQEEKWALSKKKEIELVYYRETLEAGKSRPYLIIWPESAVPGFLFREKDYLRKIRNLAKNLNSYLLVGSLHLDAQDRQYNSAFLFSPQGKVAGRYDKIKLVLFGEYVPSWPVFSNIKAIAGLGENITPGERATLFSTSKGKFGTVICFESANSSLTRKMIEQGGEMLIVITNDAWFGKTSAAAQHLEMLKARAVENGVYALQIANTGISAIVDPKGRILKKTLLDERKVLYGEVAFLNKKTFLTRYGHLFPYLTLFLGLGSFIFPIFKKRLTKNK